MGALLPSRSTPYSFKTMKMNVYQNMPDYKYFTNFDSILVLFISLFNDGSGQAWRKYYKKANGKGYSMQNEVNKGFPYRPSSDTQYYNGIRTGSSRVKDITDCSTHNGGCSHKCVYVSGRIQCRCPCGYQLKADRRTCGDSDECSINNGNCHQVCRNTAGRYQCDCNKGYYLQGDLKTCTDYNECSVNNGGCDQLCRNTEGSYECSCVEGYSLDLDLHRCIECSSKMDIVFLLDGSGSVEFQNFQIEKHFVISLINSFILGQNNVKVGLVVSSASASNLFYLKTPHDKTSMKRAINAIAHPGGATFMTTGLEFVEVQFNATNGERTHVPNIAVILTDGKFTFPESALAKAQAVKDAGISIYSVGVGNAVNVSLLRAISSRPQERNKNYFLATDYTSILHGVKSALMRELCQGNVGDSTSKDDSCNPAPVGNTGYQCETGYYLEEDLRTCSDIDECSIDNGNCNQICRNTEGRYQCDCNNGYYLQEDLQTCTDINECSNDNGGCDQRCDNSPGSYRCGCREGFALDRDLHQCIECRTQLDIVFLLDGSGSVEFGHFGQGKQFITQLTDNFIIGVNNIQVGLVVASSSASNAFFLKTFHDKTSVKHVIKSVPFPGGATFMTQGLEFVEAQFNATNGQRAYVPNIAIVITDGKFTFPKAAISKAQSMNDGGISIFSVGVGNSVTTSVVKAISSFPQEINRNYFIAANISVLLDNVKNILLRELCQSRL